MARRFFFTVINELLIIALFVVIVVTFIGPVEKNIKADGRGYYEYLPSFFIYHDLIRKDIPVKTDSVFNKRVISIPSYIDYRDYKVDKFACGTAVLELPFFLTALAVTDLEGNNTDGYQKPFHTAIFIAALFYLFLALVKQKKILELYGIDHYIIIFIQLLLVLATGVTNYAYFDAGFSHVYSLFAISAFIYFIKLYFIHLRFSDFYVACLFAGLILILRQVNVIIILILPFIAESWPVLKEGALRLIKNPVKLIVGFLIIAAVFSIQSMLWFLQTGEFLIYSYQGEGFNFLKPHFFDILFSFQKGLFVYTPVLLLALFSLIWLVYRRKYYMALTWLAFFLILTYILSSWHSWYFGASYGLRAYIDFYTIFFIPVAIFFNETTKPVNATVITISLLTIPLKVIQAYQYKEYILHWTYMDKDKYMKSFLKTNYRFKGLFWKKEINEKYYTPVKEVSFASLNTIANQDSLIFRDISRNIPGFERVKIIRITMENDFYDQNDSKIIVSISDSTTGKNILWLHKYLVNFSEKEFNQWQTGSFNFEISPMPDKNPKMVAITILSGKQNNSFKNFNIKFLIPK